MASNPDTSYQLNEDISFNSGVLAEPQARDLMKLLSQSLGFDNGLLHALMLRESSGDSKAKSGIVSTGLMQLTGGVYDDMDLSDNTGRGKNFYQDNFKKIDDSLLIKISQLGDTRTDIQGLVSALTLLKSAANGEIFNSQIRKLKTIIENEFNKGGYIGNMVLGSIYLDALKDPPKKEAVKLRISKGLNRVTPELINSMLVSKKFESVTNDDLNRLKSEIINDNKKFELFHQLYSYNGNKIKTGGVEHRMLYAIAIMLSSEQIREKTGSKLAMLRGELGDVHLA